MNNLEIHIASLDLDPSDAMNLLQGAGLVSDNAVNACDVANQDAWKAIEFLSKQPRKPKTK